MAELAAEAERAGWDGVFLEDYIVYQGRPGMATYDPWVTMAAMALSTSHVPPLPVQVPRIPVWVGGDWTLAGVRARVPRWDGCCVYKGSPAKEWQDMTADDVRGIRAAAGREEFDICLGGRERAADWDREREHIRSVAEAGATWWTEWVDPGDKQRTIEAVTHGPLRVG
jgi:alkanesulfonate monooxygenase SsuD/methylene tetrahydromethanopterin reductase-like flavin-dependent oxidoreductase (luciferase family)